jgi:hypothetical protein
MFSAISKVLEDLQCEDREILKKALRRTLIKLIILAVIAWVTATTGTQISFACQRCVRTDDGTYGCALFTCSGHAGCEPLTFGCIVTADWCIQRPPCWDPR